LTFGIIGGPTGSHTGKSGGHPCVMKSGSGCCPPQRISVEPVQNSSGDCHSPRKSGSSFSDQDQLDVSKEPRKLFLSESRHTVVVTPDGLQTGPSGVVMGTERNVSAFGSSTQSPELSSEIQSPPSAQKCGQPSTFGR